MLCDIIYVEFSADHCVRKHCDYLLSSRNAFYCSLYDMKATILRQGLSRPADLAWLPAYIDSKLFLREALLAVFY